VDEDETRGYYDIPEHAAAMCGLLERAHPGWTVRRLDLDRADPAPAWCAWHASWPSEHKPLAQENAGLLNLAMYLVDEQAVIA
jgi:hypothetical protein